MALAILILFSSCKKFVDLPLPKEQIVTATAFSDDSSAKAAVTALYSQMMAGNLFFLNGAVTVYPALSADELYNTSPDVNLDAFSSNAIPPNNFTVIHSRLWLRAYSYVFQANAALEGLQAAANLNAGLRKQLEGEVLFCRALCYWYLSNLFGDVPLITTTDYRINATRPRTPVAEVQSQVIEDLQDARHLLTAANSSTGKVRPNKWAASALLARIMLYRQEWAAAETEATTVIDSGGYSLPANLDAVFQANSSEAIWQLMPVQEFFHTGEGNAFNPSSATAKPMYALTQSLLNTFTALDKRKAAWMKSRTVAAQTYYYPYKYKVRTGGPPYSEYNTVLRLAEQYLIRAEARALQDKVPEGTDDLNIIRERAGLAPVTPGNKDTLLTAIEEERRRELFAEWGHRWFDLRRTGKIDAVLSTQKTGWQPHAALFPIPFDEIQKNPFLVQNPGY